MKILATGVEGFVEKNLVVNLENIWDKEDRVHKINGLENPSDLQICTYDIDSIQEDLENVCTDCSFVFDLAGVNRPDFQSEFMKGNFGLANTFLNTLEKYDNRCPIMLSSSIQAALIGRYGQSDYGKSKLAGENLFLDYSKETGAKVLVYRLSSPLGKWCRSNYNLAVATFCNNIANDLSIQVNDHNTELELLHIGDLIEEMLQALNGDEHYCEFDGSEAVQRPEGRYCCVPAVYRVTLGDIVALLDEFKHQPQTGMMPEIPENSLAKKLYSTYLFYLPREKAIFPLRTNVDARGSFTELTRTAKCGQLSMNTSEPGITKGEHRHHTKWEPFTMVKGHDLIQQRRTGTDEVTELKASDEKIEAIYMLPGLTHNIVDLPDTENLVTVTWANEQPDSNHSDTLSEEAVTNQHPHQKRSKDQYGY